jgi:LPS sulfotransferase NodH
VARHRDDSQPVAFIVGAPRSGTTLLSQLIARHLDVGYVSNYVSRYWMAPVYGLARFERRYADCRSAIDLRSEFGGTAGPYSPHEFGWFWQYWCGFFASDDLDGVQLDEFPWDTLREEIQAMAGYLGKPFIFKSLNYLVYNVDRFAREFPSARFIHIRREFPFVVRSVLECRVARYGTDRLWWTIRPRDVAAWRDRPPVEQVCHQIADIRRAIESSLAGLPESRRLTLEYEDLVAAPEAALQRVADLIGCPGPCDAEAVARLELRSGNNSPVDEELLAAIGEPKDWA